MMAKVKGKAEKKACPICGCRLFYVYETPTQLMLMIRCADCENEEGFRDSLQETMNKEVK